MKAPPEKLGSFYLGSEFDLDSNKVTGENVNYDARDLTTHGVCLGMTGSGKTGLCVCLLEEAALDKVPAIIIDPKGDITNLMLHFPELAPRDFHPWINLDDARRKGMSAEEYSKYIAGTWKKGLADWGINSQRITHLDESVEYSIYTPGSSSGIPVNILSSLKAPQTRESETLSDLITGTTAALLELVRIKEDPVRSREGVLLSSILEHYWRNNVDLTLEKLVKDVQDPPFRQLGVFQLETFYPKNKRMDLAIAINSLLASPSFNEWLTGDYLDISKILHTADGKPRHSIFYLAHLSDEEKMFFVTLLLEAVSSWMQGQTGTTSLRSILYFDEVFGFMPPVANPPSKKPLLRLLKQARAFGVGILLVTQNPVDVDYKGLTNTGTWFIGRLQTERDKKRVLEGLKTASPLASGSIDSNYDKLIGGLKSRVFLMHSVHEDLPKVIHSRWAMNYLRGPLTRSQIQRLMDPLKKEKTTYKETQDSFSDYLNTPPSLHSDIDEVFLMSQNETFAERRFRDNNPGIVITEQVNVYRPRLLTRYKVSYVDNKNDVNKIETKWIMTPNPDHLGNIKWDEVEEINPVLLTKQLHEGAYYSKIPDAYDTPKELNSLKKKLENHLYRVKQLSLKTHKNLKLVQGQDESEREFLSRVNQAARERRDQEVDKLKESYRKKLDRLDSKIKDKIRDISSDEAEYDARKREEILGIGETVIGIFLGSRRTTGVTTASRRRRMTSKVKRDIEESKEELEELRKEFNDIETELKQKTQEITDKWSKASENITDFNIKPRKSDIFVETFKLIWVPHLLIKYDKQGTQAEKMITAY